MHSPTGRSIDVDFYDGEKNFEKSDREYYSIGYAFEHHFDDVWTVRQNARYLRSEGQYRSLYSNYLLTDYRTIRRSTIATDVDMDAYTLDNQVQAKFDTGPLQHTLLMGLDYQNTSTDTRPAQAPTLPGQPWIFSTRSTAQPLRYRRIPPTARRAANRPASTCKSR